jgi:hypothetical protein
MSAIESAIPLASSFSSPPANDRTLPLRESAAAGSTRANNIEACFRDLEKRAAQFINESDLIVGCVAWLTSAHILRALAERQCAIVVQREDFLRPDGGSRQAGHETSLKEHYERLACTLPGAAFPGVLSDDPSMASRPVTGVRSVGSPRRSRRSDSLPGMHNKFLVSCSVEPIAGGDGHSRVVPLRVWTGSFNFTSPPFPSFENALILDCPVISQAYLSEFLLIHSLSEPLQWTAGC